MFSDFTFNMKSIVVLLFCVVPFNAPLKFPGSEKMAKKMKCLNPPATVKKVEMYVKDCQEEIRTQIVQEAFRVLRDQHERDHQDYLPPYQTHQYEYTPFDGEGYTQRRRSTSYHPTVMSHEDKRIAGCLLHCVYAKNNAIDKLGWPTLDGLVHFYSEGASDHGFFMATLRATDACLRAISDRHGIDRQELPKRGESCDLAFDVFDCISDQITEYCFDAFSP